MKLWTTVDIGKLPYILQNGLDNPYGEEIQFSQNAELVADQALSLEGELAFLETEIPDDKLDEFFVDCVASHGDTLIDAETELEYAIESGDRETAENLRALLKGAESATTAAEMFDLFGYACLGRELPPSMLKLLDPGTMLEAVHSRDAGAIAQAVEGTEATAFKSLGANFWVWLMLLLGQIFGPGYGIPQGEASEESSEEEAERLERMRQRAAKRPRKKRPKKKAVKSS